MVDAACRRLQLDADQEVSIAPNPDVFGAEDAGELCCSVRALLRGVLDVQGSSPRRYCFEARKARRIVPRSMDGGCVHCPTNHNCHPKLARQVLSCLATAEHEIERLEYFASAEGLDSLYEYNRKERRTLLEVLDDFPSAKPPLEYLIQIAPRLQPRWFSISSSPAAHPGFLHLTAAIISHKTPWGRQRTGVCTSWLAGLEPGSPEAVVPVWVRPGSLPLHPTAPLLMVGPGTGLAPMRSFMHQRQAQVTPAYSAARWTKTRSLQAGAGRQRRGRCPGPSLLWVPAGVGRLPLPGGARRDARWQRPAPQRPRESGSSGSH